MMPTQTSKVLPRAQSLEDRARGMHGSHRQWCHRQHSLRLATVEVTLDEEVEGDVGLEPEEHAVVLEVGRRQAAHHHLDDAQLRPIMVDGPDSHGVRRPH